MDYDPIGRLEAEAQRAEEAWSNGDLRAALKLYTHAIAERLAAGGYGKDENFQFEVGDFQVFERTSDLARLFGKTESADQLLAFSIKQISDAGNRYWSDLLRVKRADLALGQGLLEKAQGILKEMLPTIGDVTQISFTPAGLDLWEENCNWDNQSNGDRATIFTLLYFVMGRLLGALGQYGQADISLQRGLVHGLDIAGGRFKDTDPDGLARQAIEPIRLALAATQLEMGQLKQAKMYLVQVDGQEIAKERPHIYVQSLELEGKLNLLTGKLGPALRCFQEVLNFCAKRGFINAVIMANLNLAHTLIFLNHTLAARQHISQARELAQRNKDDGSVLRADWLLQLAAARVQSLSDDSAPGRTVTEQWENVKNEKPEYRSAEKVGAIDSRIAFVDGVDPLNLTPSANYLSFFEERALGFHWLLGRRDFAATANYLKQIQMIFTSTDSKLIKLRINLLSAVQAYYQGEYQQAEQIIVAAIPELEHLDLVPELWQALRFLNWCWIRLERFGVEREKLIAKAAGLLALMANSLSAEDRAFYLLNKWTAEEELLASNITSLIYKKEALVAAPWYRRFGLRRHLKTSLDETLAIMNRYREIVTTRTTDASTDLFGTGPVEYPKGDDLYQLSPSPPRRWWRHKSRHATISFLVLPDRIFAVRRSRFTFDFRVSSTTRIELRELVRQWHELIAQMTQGEVRDMGTLPAPSAETEKPRASSPDELSEMAQQVAAELARRLQLPSLLDRQSRWINSLTLVVDDILHGFPFAAIVYRNRFLIERYALAFAYKSGESETVPPARNSQALVVGASLPSKNLRELKFVPEELDGVVQWATRRKMEITRLDDRRAEGPPPEKELVLAALPTSAIAHFACHGQFKPDQPAQSGMMLRSAGGSSLLSVEKLAKLDLRNLRHVTLSACWSADHFILPGRWVISLPETLVSAGAESVLGSLWPVEDRIGMAFMLQFYLNLDRHSRTEALHRTQLACLNGTLAGTDPKDTSHPIFWAGYQLYGNGDRLR